MEYGPGFRAEVLMGTPDACRLAGVTYRQADYYQRTGLVRPTVPARGSGSASGWSIHDVMLLSLTGKLITMGCDKGRVMPAVDRMANVDPRKWRGLLAVTLDGMAFLTSAVMGEDAWVVDLDHLVAEVRARRVRQPVAASA